MSTEVKARTGYKETTMRQPDCPTKDKLHRIVFAINKTRVSKKMSQRRLAARAGVHITTIGAVESLRRDCYTLPNVLKICDAMHIRLSDLLKEIDL